MPEELVIDGMKLEYSGILDLRELYNFIFDFWERNGFDVLETKHKEKVSKDGKKREIEAEFSMSRDETDYAKYIYELFITIPEAKLVDTDNNYINEVSDMTIKLNGKLEYDYSSYFSKDKPFTSFLRVLYESYINKTEIKYHKDNVAKYGIEFFKELRKLLKMY